jgi:Bacterial archaeo-eukaryotic release factor family 10
MLSKNDIQFIKESIAPRTAPVLSIYFDANPAEPTNQKRGWLVRVKDTLKGLDLPRGLTPKVIHELEQIIPAAHTYVVFADDADLIKIYALQVDLPVVDLAHSRIEVRWGEPYVFPLVYALDEYSRQGVVLLDKAKWHFYTVHLGEIHEVADAFLHIPRDHTRKDEKRPAMRFEQGVVLRGGAEGDRYERHIEAAVVRFYKHNVSVLEELVAAWHIDELIFMGPNQDTRFFENYLPRALRQKVIGQAPSLPKPDPSAGEVLQKVAPIIQEKMQATERALLDEIRDVGRWTIPTVLNDLQMGRLHLLVAPWKLQGDVLRCARGLVVEDQRAAEAYCPGQATQQVALRDVLPDLAVAHGARLEFVHGESESRLLSEFGGLAGLSRWKRIKEEEALA